MFKTPLAAATWAAILWTAVAAAQSTPQATVTAPGNGALGERALPQSEVTNGLPGAAQIVTLRPGADRDGLVKEFGLKPNFLYRHALNGFAGPIDPDTIGRLKRDSRVLAVEADGPVALAGQTIPTGILRMGLTDFPVAHINSTSYWNSATGVSQPIDVDVAVLDTGIDLAHPDLNVFQTVDFTGLGWDGQDCNGHGTWVAGGIGAINNTFGVVGVAPGVRLWNVQVICPGSSVWANFLAGMEYVATNADKISVANASLGTATSANNPYVAIRTAVQSVVNQGVVFVAAAGNNGQDVAGTDGVWGVNPATGICDDFLPAAVPEAMAVSAMDVHTDQTAYFSNYSYLPRDTNFVTSPGGAIDVAAPGEDTGNASNGILSTWIGETYNYLYGTSVASPHVAGLVALYIAANGRAYDAQGVYNIRQAIVNNSLPQSQWNNANPNPMKNGVVPLPAPLAMPSENWVPQPWIVNAALVTNSLRMSFQTVPGYTYAVQYSASLTATSAWTVLTSTNGSGSLMSVTVADPAPGSASRFYRLVRQAAP
jgi:hypothetical protein